MRGLVRRSAAFILAFVAIIAYQWFAGAFQDDFYYEDSAGHFVTGVMVADYVRTAPGADPTAFAEDFYLRSPKVAFGRWPPLFHLVQGSWYLAFGASKASAMALIAAIGAATAACMFARLARLYEPTVATLALVTLAAQPLLRWHARNVMSDTLTLLFCTLATFAATDFLNERKRSKLAATVAWCLAAAATKENAYYLLLFVPLAFAMNGGWPMWRDLRNWTGVGLLIGAAVGIAAFRMWNGGGLHGYQRIGDLLARMAQANSVRDVFAALLEVAQPLTFVVAAVGLLTAVRGGASPEALLHVRLAATWIASMMLFMWVAPVPPQSRYFMPALVPLTLLIASALHACYERLGRISKHAAGFATAAVCSVLTCSAALPTPAGVRGYYAAACAVPLGRNEVTLVSADSFGENAFVVARLLVDREHTGILLRGSKVLSDSDWLGTDFQLLEHTPAEVYRYMCDVPVHFVVVDATTLPGETESGDRKLLRQAIKDHPEEFELVGCFPIQRGNQQIDRAIEVYRNATAARRRPEYVRIDLRHTLGRVLEFRLNQQTSPEAPTP